MSDKTITVVIWVVSAVWAVNVIVGMFGIGGYKPSESINVTFTGIIGLAFAARAKNRNGNGHDDGDS